MAAIVIDKLSKRYAGAQNYALKDLSISVAEGEVYGFLGSNGAGKSTTIRLLMNFLQPTSGSATICGLDIVNDSVEVKRHVGYLSGDVALYEKLTGKELLDYLGKLQPLDNTFRSSLIKKFEAPIEKRIGELSKGNRQKIGIIQALMHRPNVLILDEPTSGLDPLMQEVFYDAIKEMKKEGTAIFFSSHNLDEVQRICDKVAIIREGKLVSEQMVTEFNVLQKKKSFVVTFKDKVPTGMRSLTSTDLNIEGNRVTLTIDGSLKPFFSFLAKHEVVRLSSLDTSLEDQFLQFYGGPNR